MYNCSLGVTFLPRVTADGAEAGGWCWC